MSLAEGKYVITVDANGAYGSLQKLGREFEKTDKTTKSSISSYTRAGASLAGLGASAAGAYFSFNNLDKIQIRMAKTARVAEEQQLKVNKMLKEGKENTEEYQFELRQLQEMQDRVKASSDDLTQAQVALGFQIGGILLQIPMTISSLAAMTAGHATAAAAAIVQTGASLGLTTAIRANTAAALTNPFTAPIAIAAIVAGTALIASNFGGLRDTMFGVTTALNANTTSVNNNSSAYASATPNVLGYGTAIKSVTAEIKTLNGFQAVTNEQAAKIFEGLEKEGPSLSGTIGYFKTLEKLQNNINSDLQLAIKFNVSNALAVRLLTDDYKDEAKAAGLTTKELEFQIKHQLRLIDLEKQKEAAKERARQRDKESKKNEVKTIQDIAKEYHDAAKEARDYRSILKLGGNITTPNRELENLEVLLTIRDGALGVGDITGAEIAQKLIDERYSGSNIQGKIISKSEQMERHKMDKIRKIYQKFLRSRMSPLRNTGLNANATTYLSQNLGFGDASFASGGGIDQRTGRASGPGGGRSAAEGAVLRDIAVEFAIKKAYSESREGLQEKLWSTLVNSDKIREEAILRSAGGQIRGGMAVIFSRTQSEKMKEFGMSGMYGDVREALQSGLITHEDLREVGTYEEARELIKLRMEDQARQLLDIQEHNNRTQAMSTGVVN